MKQVDRIDNLEIYTRLSEIIKIGNKAIKEAKEENSRLGIPEVFWKKGKLYYLLSDGKITEEIPEIMKRKTV